MQNRQAGNRGISYFSKIFANLGIFQFFTFIRRGIFYSFMINYLFKLMQTVTSTATLGTLNMIASSLGQNLLWGKICDRHKLRAKLIIAGETTAACAYTIVFLTHKTLVDAGNNYLAGLTIIIGLSILEFFWSMSDVGWAALLTDVTTARNRGRIIGTLNFIASLGRMIGILFAGYLYNDGEGFRNGTIFYIVTILLFVGIALMIILSRQTKTTCTAPQAAADQKNQHQSEPAQDNETSYRWFLASLIVIILGAASINQIILLFIKLPQGLAATDPEMSLILSCWTIGGMAASLASGRLADKFGRGKTMFAGLCLAIATPLLYGFAPNVPTMALIYGINGTSFWIIQTVGFVLAGDIIPEHKRGRLLSRYNTVIALSWGPAGMLVGAPLADLQVNGLGVAAHAAYTNAFYTSSLIVAFGALLFAAKVARTKPRNSV